MTAPAGREFSRGWGIAQEFRSVALLVDIEEFAYKEVSQILEIPIGTVMSRLNLNISNT